MNTRSFWKDVTDIQKEYQELVILGPLIPAEIVAEYRAFLAKIFNQICEPKPVSRKKQKYNASS